MGPGELTRAADLLHTGLTEMRGATSPRLLLELICARILLPAAYDDESSMFARLDRLERQASQGGFGGGQPGFGDGPAQAFASAPPAPQAPPAQATAGQGSPAQGGAAQSRPAQGHDGGGSQAREEQSPPSRGADPTSSVNPRPHAASAEPGSVDSRGTGPRSGPASAPAPSAAAAPTSPAAGAPSGPPPAAGGWMDFGSIQRLWPDVVEAVKQKSRATWMTIMSGVQPVSLDGKVLTLGFDAEGRRLGFVNGGRDTVLREVFKERMGVDWRIETVVGGGGGRPPSQGSGGGGRPGPGGGSGSGFGSAQSSGFGSSSGGQAGAASGGFGSASDAQASQPASQPSRPNPVPRPANGESRARQADPGPMPPPPDEPPPPPEPAPMDESDEVDPEGDADADGTEAEMNGMALIQRELGGQIIREIDNSN
jgi:DNA polymerase-3 subunit gamma/tau